MLASAAVFIDGTVVVSHNVGISCVGYIMFSGNCKTSQFKAFNDINIFHIFDI